MSCPRREEGLITPIQQRVEPSQSCPGLTSSLTRASNQRMYHAGLLPSPQANPRLQSQDTLVNHRASPIISLELDQNPQPFPLKTGAASTAGSLQSSPADRDVLQAMRRTGKSKQQVTLLGLVLTLWTVSLRAALLHQGANGEEKVSAK